MKDTLN